MKNTKNKVIAILCVAVCIMTIGYAAFSTIITIEGTANITSEWKVVFTQIKTLSKTNGVKIKEESVEGTTATFDIELTSPGDEITYEITVENQGTLDAIIENIRATETGNEAIIFEISNIKKGDTLGKKSSTTFNVTIKYNSNVTTQPDILDNTLTINITYVQNLGQSIDNQNPAIETLERLSAPTIKQDGNVIHIYDESGKAEAFDVYVDGKYETTIEKGTTVTGVANNTKNSPKVQRLSNYTLSGWWFIDKEASKPESNSTIEQNIKFTSGGASYHSMKIQATLFDFALFYGDYQVAEGAFEKLDTWRNVPEIMKLDFGNEPQEVTQEFYEWFTANAVEQVIEPVASFDLSTLNLTGGSHIITVKARGEGYAESLSSQVISYEAPDLVVYNISVSGAIVRKGEYSIISGQTVELELENSLGMAMTIKVTGATAVISEVYYAGFDTYEYGVVLSDPTDDVVVHCSLGKTPVLE